MRIVRAIIGGFIAAIVINGGWGVFVENIGPLGGVLAATVLIGTMWFLNHYIGLIPNENNCAFIDMGLSISIACIFRDIIRLGSIKLITTSIPTFVLVIIGGAIGGTISVFVKKEMLKDKESNKGIKENII